MNFTFKNTPEVSYHKLKSTSWQIWAIWNIWTSFHKWTRRDKSRLRSVSVAVECIGYYAETFIDREHYEHISNQVQFSSVQ